MLVTIAGDLDLRDMIFFCQRERPLAGDLLLDTLFLEGFFDFVNHGYIMERKREKGFTMPLGQISYRCESHWSAHGVTMREEISATM
jgi:hypothetical protein